MLREREQIINQADIKRPVWVIRQRVWQIWRQWRWGHFALQQQPASGRRWWRGGTNRHSHKHKERSGLETYYFKPTKNRQLGLQRGQGATRCTEPSSWAVRLQLCITSAIKWYSSSEPSWSHEDAYVAGQGDQWCDERNRWSPWRFWRGYSISGQCQQRHGRVID